MRCRRFVNSLSSLNLLIADRLVCRILSRFNRQMCAHSLRVSRIDADDSLTLAEHDRQKVVIESYFSTCEHGIRLVRRNRVQGINWSSAVSVLVANSNRCSADYFPSPSNLCLERASEEPGWSAEESRGKSVRENHDMKCENAFLLSRFSIVSLVPTPRYPAQPVQSLHATMSSGASTPSQSTTSHAVPPSLTASLLRARPYKFATQCATVENPDATHKDPYGSSSVPIYQTATFKGMDGQYDYSRSGNPTRSYLGQFLRCWIRARGRGRISSRIMDLTRVRWIGLPGSSRRQYTSMRWDQWCRGSLGSVRCAGEKIRWIQSSRMRVGTRDDGGQRIRPGIPC